MPADPSRTAGRGTSAIDPPVAGAPVSHIRVLGPIQLVDAHGTAVDLPSVTQRRLVAMLALHQGSTVRSEVLAELVGLSPGALRKVVSRVRALLGSSGALHTDPTGYRLDLPVDAHRFEDDRRATARHRGDALAVLDALDAALAAWTGDALDEFRTEPWARGEAARLEELRAAALEDRVEALLELERFADAIASLDALIERHPYRDRPRGQLIRALAAAGRQADALRAYQSYRETLADEVGTEPSSSVREIERRVAAGWDGRERAATAPAPVRSEGNLPEAETSWIGSTERIKRIADQFRTARVVTLTGPGGVGKTRAALEAGRRVRDTYPGGVWLVELAAITRPEDTTNAIAAALGVQTRAGSTTEASIVQWLLGRTLLLVLDNCEHVVEAVAGTVRELARSCPTVSVLATSREPLGIAAERVVVVNGLDPADCVDLFCERARAADADATFDDHDLDAIGAICQRLDGLPLAIELAAARVRSLSPHQLRDRLGDRFAVLQAARTSSDRQRTLWTTIEWSYRLLGTEERLLFDRLSVFAGAFDLDAAEDVAGDEQLPRDHVMALLGSLVDKSMVTAERRSTTTRYRLLDTLRAFAEERLDDRGDTEAFRHRHLAHYAELAERANTVWMSRDQPVADAIFDGAWDNIRAAVAHGRTSGDPALAARLFLATVAHASNRMRSEHGDWGEQIVATDDERAVRPDVLGWTAWWVMIGGDRARALELVERGLAHAGSRRPPDPTCLAVKATSLWSSGRKADAADTVAAIDAAIGASEPPPALDEYNMRRSRFAYSTGDEWRRDAERIAELATSIGAPALVAGARFYQGTAAMNLPGGADAPAAAALHRQGIALARSVRADLAEAQNLEGLHEATLRSDEGVGVCVVALRRLNEIRYWLYLWRVVDGGAWTLASRGRLHAAAAILRHLDAHVPPWRTQPRASTRELVAGLGAGTADHATTSTETASTKWTESTEWTADEVVRFTIEQLEALDEEERQAGRGSAPVEAPARERRTRAR